MEEYKVILENGRTKWLNKNNRLHRLDGPAIEWSSGTKEWYQDGKRHRLDGPAQELSNGEKYWYQNDKLHRLDGPAAERPNGYKAWYIEGQELTEEKFNKKINPAPCEGREVEIDGVTYILKAK